MASAAALEPPDLIIGDDGRNGGDALSRAVAAATPSKAPAAEALPVPGTSSRPGKLYDTEPVSAGQVPEVLLAKPDPIFHGERDERKRESSQLHDFAMQVITTDFMFFCCPLRSYTHTHGRYGASSSASLPSCSTLRCKCIAREADSLLGSL